MTFEEVTKVVNGCKRATLADEGSIRVAYAKRDRGFAWVTIEMRGNEAFCYNWRVDVMHNSRTGYGYDCGMYIANTPAKLRWLISKLRKLADEEEEAECK